MTIMSILKIQTKLLNEKFPIIKSSVQTEVAFVSHMNARLIVSTCGRQTRCEQARSGTARWPTACERARRRGRARAVRHRRSVQLQPTRKLLIPFRVSHECLQRRRESAVRYLLMQFRGARPT